MHLFSASDDGTFRTRDVSMLTAHLLNKERKEHRDNNIASCCWKDEDSIIASGYNNHIVVNLVASLTPFNKSSQFIP